MTSHKDSKRWEKTGTNGRTRALRIEHTRDIRPHIMKKIAEEDVEIEAEND